MNEDRNQHQIIRKDARNCFVESLNDAFKIGKIHLAFATYDLSRPTGQRQTNNIHIYIAVDEFLELCRKLEGGELRYLLKNKKTTGDKTPLYQCLGGTSAEKLAKYGRSRADGKSLSRTGETDQKGLIVPKFGSKPENHVAVSMTYEVFSELLLMTRMHYTAWLSAWYADQYHQVNQRTAQPQENSQYQENEGEAEYASDPMF